MKGLGGRVLLLNIFTAVQGLLIQYEAWQVDHGGKCVQTRQPNHASHGYNM